MNWFVVKCNASCANHWFIATYYYDHQKWEHVLETSLYCSNWWLEEKNCCVNIVLLTFTFIIKWLFINITEKWGKHFQWNKIKYFSPLKILEDTANSFVWVYNESSEFEIKTWIWDSSFINETRISTFIFWYLHTPVLNHLEHDTLHRPPNILEKP